MKDWRKLRKAEIIHIIDAITEPEDIERLMRETRQAQKAKAESNNVREICWDCKTIAQKLGIE